MTIGADSAIEFFGTQDTVTSSTAAVNNAAFSAQEDTWTNDDDAPMAAAILECTFSVAPDANSTVDLYARPLNLKSASPEPGQDTPDANFPHVYLGSFPLNDVTTEQFIAIDVRLPNTKSQQVYEFYIHNNGGQTISAGWDLHITPKTIGPHA